ncbi:hypothetical protein C0033_12770 [Clostridium sp. chh4-2]|uniref:heme-binding protein n=1 Tax=Clostridium sp. chh4-2 TaxID=2067550 RepID=UPI000CCE7E6C|nr:heme-binding protein [Clostridium sp. chh4-2]PNV59634.1 hypothetical protein C0033_23120 [Clostridium sp. chh4-2]PNV61754.1 hypothetical protein C0033_12770 [Clostridium sp. chh4-2]
MGEYERRLSELKQETEEIHFKRFLAEDAYKLGNRMVQAAMDKGVDLAVMIRVNQKMMFYFAFDGTDLNHERAVIRKSNVSDAFRCPSLKIFYELQQSGLTIKDRGRDPMEYLALGGAVPIYVEQAGIIGTICVSGMSHFEDHQFAVDCIKGYLAGSI